MGPVIGLSGKLGPDLDPHVRSSKPIWLRDYILFFIVWYILNFRALYCINNTINISSSFLYLFDYSCSEHHPIDSVREEHHCLLVRLPCKFKSRNTYLN